jgi:hypothetical protein
VDEKPTIIQIMDDLKSPRMKTFLKRSKLDSLTLHLKHMSLVHMLNLLGLLNFKLVGNGELEFQFGCPLHPFPFVPIIATQLLLTFGKRLLGWYH